MKKLLIVCLFVFFSILLFAFVKASSLIGDVDDDCDVDIFDIVSCTPYYGYICLSLDCRPSFPDECDFNNDGRVNIFDIAMMAGNYGKKC